ncbi:MAG: DUF6580 family putative transport protein, partial [Planctomycetota bacterium]
PIAAIAVLAGLHFRSVGVAMLAPFLAMLISDFSLLGYSHFGVMLTVYGAMMAPAMIGARWRAKPTSSRTAWLGRAAFGGVAPATLFFVATNFAVWCFQSDYPTTAAGLVNCYVNALPFYRQMLAGDLVFVPLMLGAAWLSGVSMARLADQPAVVRATR